MLVLLELSEFIVFLVIAIKILIKIWGFAKRKIKVKQQKLCNYGMLIGLIGVVIPVSPSGDTGVLPSDKVLAIECLFIFAGCALILVGLQCILAAYKSEEENPKWIKWISKLWGQGS
jgi:hypothetical protein